MGRHAVRGTGTGKDHGNDDNMATTTFIIGLLAETDNAEIHREYE
jgi:hypothetical protein